MQFYLLIIIVNVISRKGICTGLVLQTVPPLPDSLVGERPYIHNIADGKFNP